MELVLWEVFPLRLVPSCVPLGLLASWDMQVSMSHKGACFDHAMMESFNATLKGECTDRHSWSSRAQARQAIFEFIEVYYNRSRRPSSLGYMSPVAFEQIHA
jgi:putative transposase